MTAEAPRRGLLEQLRQHARLDLQELDDQVAAGEIDLDTADRLRAAYEQELAEAEAALAAIQADDPDDGAQQPAPATRSPKRAIVGTVALIAVFTLAIVFIGGDTVPSQQGAAAGIDNTPRAATNVPGTLDSMEEVVADDPNNVVLRLVVADAYFERAEYSPSLGHYLAVLESSPTSEQESIALGRVGWMAFITNQVDAADDYLRRSLGANPDNMESKLFLGYVRYLGFDDADGAIPLLEEALEISDLGPQSRAELEGTLEAARNAAGSP